MNLRTLLSSSSLLLSLSLGAGATQSHFVQAPVAFEPNVGQSEADNVFVARGVNYGLALSRSGPRLSVRGKEGVAQLHVRLLGANESSSWQAAEPLPGKVNYLHGKDSANWKTNIPTFGRIYAADLYPGIDLSYYGNQQQLEYDFTVAPGADPRTIRMHFDGARTVSLNGQGELIIDTGVGQLIERKPVIYQQFGIRRRAIDGRFLVARNGDVSFHVAAYDKKAPLTIDPVLAYSTFIGAGGSDQANAIAVDSSSNFYVTGATTGSTGGYNVLIRKFAANGTQIFTSDLGGGGDDWGNGIKVGSDGSIYVAGWTKSSDFPVVNANQSTLAGSVNAFVMRVNPNGQGLIFATYLGGNADDEANGLAIDSLGSVYLTGFASSTNFPTTTSSLQPTSKGGKDAFVTKYNAQGQAVYSTLVGGSSDDVGSSIAVDASGNTYVTGNSASSDFPQVNNPFQHSLHGVLDAIIVELNATGTTLIYSSLFGGTGSDYGYGIVVDAAGSAYVAGKTGSLDFPTTNGVYSGAYNGGDNDMFVAKFTAGQAGLTYSTLIGSHGNDEAYAIAVDGSGNAFVAGDSDSDQFPVTSGAVQPTRKGNRDAIVAEIDPNGAALLYSSYLGGSQNDIGYGIALDSANNAYVAGITSSTDFPLTSGAFQAQAGGGGNPDAFVSVIFFSSVGGTPTVNSGGVVNNANFKTGAVAPGSVIAIFGANFLATPTTAPSVPLPTSLGGVSVSINGTPAPLYFVGLNQINAQLPVEVTAGQATITVTTGAGTSPSETFTVAQTAPYLTVDSSGRGAIENQDGSVNSPNNPAHAGSIVAVFFTGVGPVNGTVVDGVASPDASSTQAYSATIGGNTANVTFVGLSPGSVGLAQANIQVPTGVSTGDLPVVLTVGGVASNSALLAVTP